MTTPFETYPLECVYQGTMGAYTYEVLPVGPDINPTTLIRTDQAWGIRVDWTMTGGLVLNLQEEFQVRAYLEDMSPADRDIQLGPVAIATEDGTLDRSGPSRTYSTDIAVSAGDVAAGVYKITVLIQLFEEDPPQQPWPVAAFADLPLINVYQV